MSPLLIYSPIFNLFLSTPPTLSRYNDSVFIFTWVNDGWRVSGGGGGICLPFHCDCGLKCCAQDCQMTHVLVKFSQVIYFVVLVFTAPDGDKWHAIVATRGMNLKCDQCCHVRGCKQKISVWVLFCSQLMYPPLCAVSWCIPPLRYFSNYTGSSPPHPQPI